MKKINLFICGMFCAVTLNAQPWYIGSPNANDIKATLNDGILTISGTGEMKNFTSGVPQPWESQQSSIISVIIEEGVTSIGEWAFFLCSGLTSAIIPASVETIGISSFRESSIRSVTILGNSLKTIDDAAFYRCESLESITIPESVTSINSFAFQHSSIHSVTISGNSLKKIGTLAFASCVNLTSITIPASVDFIGLYAFRESGVQIVTILGNTLKTIDYGAFYECISLESITIPASVEIIEEWAFANCSNLAEIINFVTKPVTVLNNTFNGIDFNSCKLRVPVKSIEDYKKAAVWSKFKNIEPIESIVRLGSTGSISWFLYSNDVLVFSGTGIITNEVLSDTNLHSIPYAEHIVFTEGITGIDSYGGLGDFRPVSISIPASLTMMNNSPFLDCSELITITVHDDNPEYASVDGVLFSKDLTTLFLFPGGITGHYDIPSTVTTIYWAFDKCHLTSITIPSSVKIIEGDCRCSSTTSIEVEPGNTNYSSAGGVLFNFDKTELIAYPPAREGLYNIPSSVKNIGDAAFMYCEKLTTVTISNSVETIGVSAFFGCAGLGSLLIPASVSFIDRLAFSRCPAMTAITVHEDNQHFSSEDGALLNKDKTMLLFVPTGRQGQYVVPVAVNSIGYDVFYSCEQLTSIIFQGNVTFMNDRYFDECSSLTEIILLNPAPADISSVSFSYYMLTLCTLRVPSASVGLYKSSEGWKKFNKIEGIDVIALDYSAFCLLTGAEKTLLATLDKRLPETQIDWTSTNTAAVTINSTGKVTAIKPGTSDVTVSAFGNDATCTVTVLAPGNSTISGTIDNSGTGNMRVNLYIKVDEKGKAGETKRGIIGGYVLLATAIPNDNGEYSFENLPEGSYKIEVEIDEYEPCVTDELPLSENETLTNIDFTVDEDEGIIIVEGDPVSDPDPDLPTGIVETWHAASLQIYPNPFTDVVHINVETGRAPSLRIQVINTAGVVVHTQTITSPDETIHLRHLPAGMYFFRLENDGKAKTEKMIKIQ